MMKNSKNFVSVCSSRWLKQIGRLAIVLVAFLSQTAPAMAHHPMEGRTPATFWEGFLSGIAHPIIGLDHFAFVVAIGLICAGQGTKGFSILAAFVVAAMAGTGIHLLQWNLPATEIIVSASVILFGAILVSSKTLSWLVLSALAAMAGVFHGYAYGEAIVGAGMTPLLAYLAGFTLIQYGVGVGAMALGRVLSQKLSQSLRFAGLAICAIGSVFLMQAFAG